MCMESVVEVGCIHQHRFATDSIYYSFKGSYRPWYKVVSNTKQPERRNY